jgi:hypothetical protein
MRTAARVFGILLVIAGIAYSAMAIYMLGRVDEIATTLEIAKATEHKEFGFASIEDWKRGIRFNIWLYLTIGLTAIVCGLGIAAQKEWARKAWLTASAILLGYLLIAAAYNPVPWVFYVELLAFAVPSFVLLRRQVRTG